MVLDNMPEKPLTVKQLSEYLQVSDQSIKRAIYSGKLDAFKIGRDWRIEKEAVLKWVNLSKK